MEVLVVRGVHDGCIATRQMRFGSETMKGEIGNRTQVCSAEGKDFG